MADMHHYTTAISQIVSTETEEDVVIRGHRLSDLIQSIPAHATDPRAPALLKVAQESGAAGPYCRLLVAIERELSIAKRRAIPINLDGIVAALVLDFGFSMGCAAAFVMIPRSSSTLAHHLEEKAQMARWRHVPQEYVTYTGPLPGDDVATGK
jgi:citrate synthase